MQSFLKTLTGSLSLTTLVLTSNVQAQQISAKTAPPDRPLASLPYTPGLDVKAMDRSVDPCEDLYTYSCGGWQKANPIPADQSSWSLYRKISVDNQRYLWGLLETDAKATQRSATQQKIGDYFSACMDQAAIEKLGLAPVQADLARIAALKSVQELPALLGDLHSRTYSGGIFFGAGVEQDARDASKMIPGIYAGGIGLPDRDYYFKEDAKSKEIRARYVEHVAKILVLSGESSQTADAEAVNVMRIETSLAKASLTMVDKRDPYKIYHRFDMATLAKLTPAFNWTSYFNALGMETKPWLDVSEPNFFGELNAVLDDATHDNNSLSKIKAYLRWSVLNAQARYLSHALAAENFNFYSSYLRGVPQDQPRWQKCVALVDRDLGEALGREFVAQNFPEAIKGQTLRMTKQIEAAMAKRITALDWMSPATKAQALAKLYKMRNKIGYPDVWRDYSALSIAPQDFYGNLRRAALFETQRQAAKIGKPVDHSEWGMTPVTVNAYYNPPMNDINFPAAVLLPPLYDPKMDDAPNYGNTGGTIGHELTHGFDDEGRQYDGGGNLRNWWQKKDTAAFEKGAQCVRDQYAQYTIVDDIKINSKLTAGEDIADFGGLLLAWMAWQEQTKNMQLTSRDNLTPEQRFFVGFAQWACSNERPENLRVSAMINPHSPSKDRINGVVVNMPEFAEAFRCKANQALVKKPQDVCKIW